MKNNKNLQINFLRPKKSVKKPHKFYTTSLIVLMLGIFLLPQVGYFSTISAQAIINLTNTERKTNNLDKLQENELLDKAAYLKAQAILESQSFQHNIGDQKFSYWIKAAGYEYEIVGENLAIDFVTDEGVINAWKKSPSHRSNLLNKDFTEIGVAVMDGKFQNQTSTVVVQIFGNPLIKIAGLTDNKPNPTPNQPKILGTIETNNGYSTPIFYANRSDKTYTALNFAFIDIFNIFYALRYLPLLIVIAAVMCFIYLNMLNIFKSILKKQISHNHQG